MKTLLSLLLIFSLLLSFKFAGTPSVVCKKHCTSNTLSKDSLIIQTYEDGGSFIGKYNKLDSIYAGNFLWKDKYRICAKWKNGTIQFTDSVFDDANSLLTRFSIEESRTTEELFTVLPIKDAQLILRVLSMYPQGPKRVDEMKALAVTYEGFQACDYGVFREKKAVMKQKNKYGYIDECLNYVIPPQYENATCFISGIARVKKDGKWYEINTSGKILGEASVVK